MNTETKFNFGFAKKYKKIHKFVMSLCGKNLNKFSQDFGPGP